MAKLPRRGNDLALSRGSKKNKIQQLLMFGLRCTHVKPGGCCWAGAQYVFSFPFYSSPFSLYFRLQIVVSVWSPLISSRTCPFPVPSFNCLSTQAKTTRVLHENKSFANCLSSDDLQVAYKVANGNDECKELIDSEKDCTEVVQRWNENVLKFVFFRKLYC